MERWRDGVLECGVWSVGVLECGVLAFQLTLTLTLPQAAVRRIE